MSKESWNEGSYESYKEEAICGQESETLLWWESVDAAWKTLRWSDKSKFEFLFDKYGRYIVQTKTRGMIWLACISDGLCISACEIGSLHWIYDQYMSIYRFWAA